jgi:2-hydroxy-3-oxopropionate reductase
MKTIGFIGLGIMGKPMAANLLSAGFDVIVHSRRRESANELVSKGARWADTISDAAAGQDAVITMLPDSPDVESVAMGDGGILASAESGMLFVDMSTIRPEVARTISAQADARGVRMLDAPVSGGERGAIDGTLSIMVGGSGLDFAAAAPLFDALGKTVVHVGPSGSGQTVKAANQLMVGGIIQLVAEALVIVERSGVDVAPALTVLAGGLAGSRVLDAKGAAMHERQFAAGFRIDLHHKDMGIALETGRALGLPLPLTGVVAQLFIAARAQGLGSLDHSALLAALDLLAGGVLPGRDPIAAIALDGKNTHGE